MSFLQTDAPAGTGSLAGSAWVLEIPTDGPPPSSGLQLLPEAGATILWTVGPAPEGAGRISVLGPLTRSRPFAVVAGSSTVGIQLRPGVAQRVFGIPVAVLRDREVGLERLWPDVAAALRRDLGRDGSAVERLAALGGRLADRASGVRPGPRLADLLAALADGSEGRVTEWAARAGWAPRTLRRQFELELGLSPAAFRRILRFERLLASAWRPDLESWADRAAAAGYYDQAHMNRDVRALAGVTPARLLNPCRALLSA